jgi:class 3 adenylate cyclase
LLAPPLRASLMPGILTASGAGEEGVGVSELPSGTVTFLFTDIEGSTRLWQQRADAMRPALAQNDTLLQGAVEVHDGYVVKTMGEGVHAAFATASDAIAAAIDGQIALAAEPWPLPSPLRVRMGVHTGPAELRDGDYYGTTVNRAARIMSVAHGGQIVMSVVTQELARGDGVEAVDLGEHRLKDLAEAERIFQVVHPQLDREFPPVRALETFATNLPAQHTSFVGRDAELRAVSEALADTAEGSSRILLRASTEGPPGNRRSPPDLDAMVMLRASIAPQSRPRSRLPAPRCRASCRSRPSRRRKPCRCTTRWPPPRACRR